MKKNAPIEYESAHDSRKNIAPDRTATEFNSAYSLSVRSRRYTTADPIPNSLTSATRPR
jgi:hypothetical protein